MNEEACPLCGAAELRERGHSFSRRYRECGRCRLLSMHPADHPSTEDEERRYRLHQNRPDDCGYRAFLQRLLDPVVPRLRPGARGLDFGCGAEPVLASLAAARGLACSAFDPFFHPVEPTPPYDFILASEVFEHFRCPAREIARVVELLDAGGSDRPGGLLAVMTLFWRDREDLSAWHYLSDPTHVSIYRAETFAFIEARYGLRAEWSDGERVVLLRRDGRAAE